MGQDVRVLVCDDNRLVREMLVLALSTMDGIEVVADIESAEELPDAIQRSAPQVLLMDVRMPGMTGLEAIEKLRASGNGLPVIVMSADSQSRAAAFAAGARGFVYKGATSLSDLAVDIHRVADAPLTDSEATGATQ